MVSNRNLNEVPSNSASFVQYLMSYTTHSAFCVLFLPFVGLYKLFSRYGLYKNCKSKQYKLFAE